MAAEQQTINQGKCEKQSKGDGVLKGIYLNLGFPVPAKDSKYWELVKSSDDVLFAVAQNKTISAQDKVLVIAALASRQLKFIHGRQEKSNEDPLLAALAKAKGKTRASTANLGKKTNDFHGKSTGQPKDLSSKSEVPSTDSAVLPHS